MSARPIRLIFATDNPDTVSEVDPELNQAADVEIVGAYTPSDDIVSLVTINQPDVVVLDYDLIDFDAAEIARTILRDDSSIQVLMLSVVNSVEDIRHAMRAGARDYLVKPLRPGELLDTIYWLIQERREYARMQAFVRQMRKAYEALFTDDKPVPPTVVAFLEQQAAKDPHDRLAQETLAVAYARNRDWAKLAPLVAELARTKIG
nr:response regulator [Anaerolineae bacterium]